MNLAVSTRRAELDSANDFFLFCKEKYTRGKDLTSEGHSHYRRDFFFAADILWERERVNHLKPLNSTRQQHCVRSVQPYVVSYRERSCFCDKCLAGGCTKSDITGAWKIMNLQKGRQGHRRQVPPVDTPPKPNDPLPDAPPEPIYPMPDSPPEPNNMLPGAPPEPNGMLPPNPPQLIDILLDTPPVPIDTLPDTPPGPIDMLPDTPPGPNCTLPDTPGYTNQTLEVSSSSPEASPVLQVTIIIFYYVFFHFGCLFLYFALLK